MSSEIRHNESLSLDLITGYIFAVFFEDAFLFQIRVLEKKNKIAPNHITKKTSIDFCAPIVFRKNNQLVIFKVTFVL